MKSIKIDYPRLIQKCMTSLVIFALVMTIGTAVHRYDSRRIIGSSDMFTIRIFELKDPRLSMVTVFEGDKMIFTTKGYMESGFHRSGTLHVYWLTNQTDFIVRDDRGTEDVYVYNGISWDGPYRIIRTTQDGIDKYWLISTAYGHIDDRIVADYIREYDKQYLPDEILNGVYMDYGYVKAAPHKNQ